MTAKLAYPLALAAAILLAPTPGMAQRMGPPPDRGPGPNLERMMDKLDLTDQQRASVDAILAEHRDAAVPAHEEMMAARDALHEAIHADTFDEAEIRHAAAALSELEADWAVERARFRQEVRKVLTPEQRELLDQMWDQRRGRMNDRPRRGMGGRGGGARRGDPWR